MVENKNKWIMWLKILHYNFNNVLLRSLEWLLIIKKSFFQGSLVTVEKYVKGKFSKYSVNNNSEMKRTYVLKLKLQFV